MIKEQEIADERSCLNRAKPYEMLFTLLARDPAAPVAIRAWIGERLRLGKNVPGDMQIIEAEACALEMERQYNREHHATETGNPLAEPTRVRKWDAAHGEYRWVQYDPRS